jgi:hypothetical protein
MKIAIISDIHDNAHNLVQALELIYKSDAEKIIFLGDFVGAAIANLLVSSEIPVFAIWGNNDGDRALITKFSLGEKSNLEVGFDIFDTFEIDGKKLFLTHYPFIAKSMAKSGDFDAVFYGHNHLKHKERIGNCLLLNPGEVGAYKTGEPTLAMYDTQTNDAEILKIPNSITANTKISQKKFKEISYEFNKLKGHSLG